MLRLGQPAGADDQPAGRQGPVHEQESRNSGAAVGTSLIGSELARLLGQACEEGTFLPRSARSSFASWLPVTTGQCRSVTHHR